MKLKGIKIKAFRLFDNVDLSFVNHRFTEKGCANFVSIYAPNGFGKTSLFDAIEFGMTSNIHRLKLSNFSENMRFEKRLSDFSSFIHNKKLPEEDIHIRLELEEYGDGVVDRVISKDEEKNLLIGDGDNKFFSEAILSQDWFSEFLSVNDAEMRFTVFMKNFHESQDLLEYHSQLKSKTISLSREKGKLTNELNELQKELKNDIDEHIVERLDEIVAELNNLGIVVNWKQEVDTDSLTKLVIEAEKMIARENAVKTQLDKILENCEKLEGGQEGLIAVNQLSEHLTKIQGINKQIDDLQQRLKKVERLKELLDLIQKFGEEQREYSINLARQERLVENYSQYKQFQTIIDDKTNEITACDNELNSLNEQIANLNNERDIHQEARRTKKAALNVIDNKIKSLESDYTENQNCLREIALKQTEKAELLKKIDRQNAVIESQKHVVTRFRDIRQKVYERKVDVKIEGYEVVTEKIIILSQRIIKHSNEIDKLTKSIEKQNAYQSQVRQLVNRSREMVSELNTGVCPLCGSYYSSVEQLLKSIENNKAVSASIERDIVYRDELNKIIKQDQQDREKVYLEFEKKIDEAVDNGIQTLNALIDEQERMETAMREADKAIKMNIDQVEYVFAGFKGLTKEQVEREYNESTEKLKADIQEIDKAIEDNNKALEVLNQKLKVQEERRQKAQKAITEIWNCEDYLKYQRLLGSETANDISLMLWIEHMPKLKETIAQYDEQINEANEEFKLLKEQQQIDLSNEAPLQEELKKINKEKGFLNEQYYRTLQFLKEKCRIKDISIETTAEDIIALFENTKAYNTMSSDYSEKSLIFLSEFKTMLGIAEKYNQQQLVKKRIQTIETKICQNEYNQTIVLNEINRLQVYLEDYVKNFFQVERIQKLYNTIDPHPEYKEIRFDCDFSRKKPRLNVYMKNKFKGNDAIVPTLYFSTAQINILSFCIFMAKALFAKTDSGQNVGCVFIDDPIQALDEINILSMIDLLRNVAFSLDRQIVLTTHDQNFFELLQKKIPQSRFNSCFLMMKERGVFTPV